MPGGKTPFSLRQTMITPDFEFFHYRNPSTTEVDNHNHDFYEIYILLSGRVTYMIEGRTYRLKPWDILLINHGELHRPVIETGEWYERMVIWVDPRFAAAKSTENTDLSMCFETPFHSAKRLLRPENEMLESLRNILVRFEEACCGSGFGSSVLRETYLTELLIFLNRAYLDVREPIPAEEIEYNEKISAVIRYINSHLSGGLTLDQLASRFYISKYHLLREFKKHTGYTLHRYIQHKRLAAAKACLGEGLSLTEVCAKCGFSNYSHFIRSFKEAFGISPKRFAKTASAQPINSQ